MGIENESHGRKGIYSLERASIMGNVARDMGLPFHMGEPGSSYLDVRGNRHTLPQTMVEVAFTADQPTLKTFWEKVNEVPQERVFANTETPVLPMQSGLSLPSISPLAART